MKKAILLFSLIIGMYSCKQSGEPNTSWSKGYGLQENDRAVESDMSMSLESDIEIDPSFAQENEPNESKVGEMIIREGNMLLEVETLEEGKAFVDSIVNKYDAYYENERLRNSENSQNIALKLRIPSRNYSVVVHSIEKVNGEILEKNIHAKDVTSEYLDLEIRLNTNIAYLKRYREMLKVAKEIKEMIPIQEKIRQIEKLIDTNKGRMKYLNNKVEYGVLNVEIVTRPEEFVAAAPPTFGEDASDAFKNGVYGVKLFALVVINFWPILFVILLIMIYKRRRLIAFFR